MRPGAASALVLAGGPGTATHGVVAAATGKPGLATEPHMQLPPLPGPPIPAGPLGPTCCLSAGPCLDLRRGSPTPPISRNPCHSAQSSDLWRNCLEPGCWPYATGLFTLVVPTTQPSLPPLWVSERLRLLYIVFSFGGGFFNVSWPINISYL